MTHDGAHVLVINAGSSSLKYSLVDGVSGEARPTGRSSGSARLRAAHAPRSAATSTARTGGRRPRGRPRAASTPSTATARARPGDLRAVGHRVVHGGAGFRAGARRRRPRRRRRGARPLAPLHNPANLEGLRVARKLFPDLPQVAVFDTAFHQTLPPHAYTYAVPRAWREEHQDPPLRLPRHVLRLRLAAAADLLGRAGRRGNVVVLHLGNGARRPPSSGGSSVDTSMGLTRSRGW